MEIDCKNIIRKNKVRRLKEEIKQNKIKVRYITIKDDRANLFTRPLDLTGFEKLTK